MRTTITLNDLIAAEARERAHEAHQTLGQFIEDALRVRLAQRPSARPRSTEPPTFSGGRLMPGISATSAADIFEHLDDEEQRARS